MLCELLDAETTAERAAQIREIIARCPGCFRRLEDEQAARVLVRDCCGAARAPEGLKRRILAQITTLTVSQVTQVTQVSQVTQVRVSRPGR
ncbi:mycothiol system anti-sigma-R factor [Corynebacterium liangguodongii]|uniref:Mycothiol system anti-sigma-R factor n=2 Tax=Corynebacterium liangguodongii TaxID=2079535 RepID=A0A2S0WGW8_9CORY|nr:mycothiol system anti-sigma-R factor [Corynebacterium liangguodongii]PWC00672.1 mycothiol system anti-sigma-R factor [Corynebacterium liangguodongii]